MQVLQLIARIAIVRTKYGIEAALLPEDGSNQKIDWEYNEDGAEGALRDVITYISHDVKIARDHFRSKSYHDGDEALDKDAMVARVCAMERQLGYIIQKLDQMGG